MHASPLRPTFTKRPVHHHTVATMFGSLAIPLSSFSIFKLACVAKGRLFSSTWVAGYVVGQHPILPNIVAVRSAAGIFSRRE